MRVQGWLSREEPSLLARHPESSGTAQPTDDSEVPSQQELKNALEKGSDDDKIKTLKRILILMLNGDPMPGLLMHVIRFIMPSKNKTLKKLLLVYWEVCPKTNPDGKLKQEMVLVCNALRNDLLHPNEFIRGNTLRYLCKLREAEILEPLIPSVRASLEHKHPYVRKHAVFAVYMIYKNFEHLIPDAGDLVEAFLQRETDSNAKRNAFIMLLNTHPAKAVAYFNAVHQQVPSMDPYLQLAIMELIRKDCRNSTAEKAKYIQCIFALLHSSSHAVKYEAANTLVALTSNVTAIKAAATCYIELIVKEADNNVKLIVLDKLKDLREQNERILDDLVMDILRVLSSPDIDVRRKALDIALEMVSSRNVKEVVAFLKKELIKTHENEYEKTNEYRQLLVQAIHACAIRFAQVTDSVVHVLMDFLSEAGSASAVDVITFVREVMEKFPDLRETVIPRLLEVFGDIKTGRVFRGALWILGEYALTLTAMESTLEKIRTNLGDLPIVESEQRAKEEADGSDLTASPSSQSSPTTKAGQPKVLADGTYATETAFSSRSPVVTRRDSLRSKRPPLRQLLLTGDYYLGASISNCLTKLSLRYADECPNPTSVNAFKSYCMLIMTSIIRAGKSEFTTSAIDEDSLDRILTCLRVLSTHDHDSQLKSIFLEQCRTAFTVKIQNEEEKKQKEKTSSPTSKVVQVDDGISFRLLKSKKATGAVEDAYEMDLNRATGLDGKEVVLSSNKLKHIVPMSGYSDPVYVEAYVNVHQYDILLDILIVNQTNETLQNLTVEFSTLGDLKLVERPAPHTIGPHGFHSLKCNVKVASTETGVLFGHVVYEGKSAVDVKYVVLKEVQVDILEYIKPATCTDLQFRSMWTEFEWENKINVDMPMSSLVECLKYLNDATHMRCITPEHALSGDCGFLAANVYAKTLFGDDALANVSLEQLEPCRITGHVRIRSKTQGIALALGDKISLCQKAFLNPGTVPSL